MTCRTSNALCLIFLSGAAGSSGGAAGSSGGGLRTS